MNVRFGDFEIDTVTFELLQQGVPLSVEPKVFDLICHFAKHPDRVFSREELIDAVWSGRIVSDATVATCVKNARKALGDTGEQQSLIQTVRGRGYRFCGVVEEQPPAQDKEPMAPAFSGNPGSDPSIMILPLHCGSENLEFKRLSSEISNSIGRIMSRVPLLRFSSEANHYSDHPTPPTARAIHDDFGVDLVLDGYLQDQGTRGHVVIQLSNARTGFQLWSDSFSIEQPFYVHIDELVASAIGKLEPQIHKAMYSMVRDRSDAPSARELFLEASSLLVLQGWSHTSFDLANELLKQSAELDSEFALTHALQSLLYGFSSRIGLSVDPSTAQNQARKGAERALELDPMDSTVVGLAGCSLADIGDVDRGENLLRNAIDLNPANAQAWVALGVVRLAQLDAKEAIEMLSKGINISPHDSRLSIWGAFLSVAYLLNKQLDEACEQAELACRRHDQTYLPRIALAASRLIQKEPIAAQKAMKDARRIKPDLSAEQLAALVGPNLAASLLDLENTEKLTT